MFRSSGYLAGDFEYRCVLNICEYDIDVSAKEQNDAEVYL